MAHGRNGTCGSDLAPPLAPPNVPSPPPSAASPRPRPPPGPRPRIVAARRSNAVVPSASTMRSPMLVMYGTFQTPFSPATRPRLGVPSARRGVGSDGPAGPPRPRSCAPAPMNAVKKIAASALSSAPRSRFRTATSCASALLLLLRGIVLARCGEQPLSACRQDDDARVADVRAVLRLAALDRYLVANLERVAGPALAHQAVGAPHLHAPVHDVVPFGDIQIEVGVRVHPLNLGDDTFEVHRSVRVEFRRERVMRDRSEERRVGKEW